MSTPRNRPPPPTYVSQMHRFTARVVALSIGGTLLIGSTLGCGFEEGDLVIGDDMPSLQWEGYVNETAEGLSTEQPFGDYGIDQLAATGKRYALLHTAEAF
jgi:hypothetical protein